MKKDLQKFTDFESKLNYLFSLKQITNEDCEILTKEEKFEFNTVLAGKVNNKELIDDELDNLLFKLDKIMPKSAKNQIWERNHNTITAAISSLMQDYGRMPTRQEISIETGISRQTVHKHLREFIDNPLYLEIIQQYKFMGSKVLAKVFKFAVNGDISAAKLYFNVIGGMENLSQAKVNIKTQNNYIQINGNVYNEEKLKALKPEQMQTIETILQTVIKERPLFSDTGLIE